MHAADFSSIAANLLALFLSVAWPVWDYFATQSLKAHPSGTARLDYYRQTAACLWIAAGIGCWTEGFGKLVTLHGLGIRAAWLQRHLWSRYLLATIVILFVVVQLIVPIVQVSVKYRKRPFLEPRQFEYLRFFLPASTVERRWFAALSITAGFCEELLFRGFLLRYLHTSPLHLPFVWAALASALILGAHHLYQGRQGFLSTAMFGLVFTAALLVTGNLWAGMVCHAAIDLSILLYWRPKPAVTVAA
jgi:membrane protease YdiL (CAAX protease family)